MPQDRNRLEGIILNLRDQGHRVTPQRRAILSTLIGNPNHPTVEDIHTEVQLKFPSTSLATVYKTVNLLTETGEISEINQGNEKARYDGFTKEPHPHLICAKCKSIIDFDVQLLAEHPQESVRKAGYQFVGYQFDFYGICPKCQEK